MAKTNKIKTHKGAQKRMKVTAKGKIKYGTANKGHLMTHKNGKRARQLRKKGVLSEGKIVANYRRMLND